MYRIIFQALHLGCFLFVATGVYGIYLPQLVLQKAFEFNCAAVLLTQWLTHKCALPLFQFISQNRHRTFSLGHVSWHILVFT